MNALQFLQKHSRAHIEQVCAKANTNLAYFRHIAYGHRRPSPEMCRRLEAASEYALSRVELRPDIYCDLRDHPKAEERRKNRRRAHNHDLLGSRP